MIIPLKKLLSMDKNRYIFTRAAMVAVDRIDSLTDLMPEEEKDGKIVPIILNTILEEKIQYELVEMSEDAEE